MRVRPSGSPLLPALAALACLALGAAPARAEQRVIETPDLRLIYQHPTLDFIAPHTVRCFENAMRFHRGLFEYTPSEKVTVILDDFADYSNAAVWGSPRNTMQIHVAPSSFAYETGPSNERINFLMNHELAHVVTLDQTTGFDRDFRRLFFGKARETSEHPESMLWNYLTVPRRAAPRWHREGTAVFLETWMAGGLGRAQGPYDEMVFRSMVRDSSHFWDPLGLESQGTKVDFQIGVNAYLYGTRFSTWLADRWSPAKFMEWVARRPGSRGYYANQFKEVFGLPLTEAWRRWVADEHAFQRANLDSIRRHPTTAWRDLSPRALGSVSNPCLDRETRTIYAAVFYPGTVAHIAAIPLDGGPIRRLLEIKGPTLYSVSSLAWDSVTRTLFFTADNNEWRELCALDVTTGKSRVLIRDARLGDLAFNAADRSLWAVRHFNGISTLVRLEAPYTDWRQVFSFPYGRDVYDLDVSPDGRWLVTSMGEINGRHSLRLLATDRLVRRDTTSRTLFDFGSSIPTSFVFSPDGRRLYGSSYYTGVSNIFRYDLDADSMDVVSNCETGFFRPLPLAGDSLFVFRYSGEGFVPAEIEGKPLADVSAITFYGQQVVERHPELKSWRVPSPLTVNVDSVKVREGRYRPLASVRMVSLYPVVESYKQRAAIGANAVFQDPWGSHDGSLSLTYTPDEGLAADERWHATFAWRHAAFETKLKVNPASFYDLVGPTRTARKGTGASVHWSRMLLRDLPREIDLSADVVGWTGLERLPDAQNISTSPGFDKLLAHSLELSEKNTRSSIGSVDAEKGYRWHVAYANNGVRFVRGGDATWRGFPQFDAGLEAGTPLPVRNSSLWLRTAGGWSPGDRAEPFANFFFGGFGNNWLDHQDVKRYRQPGSFPGTELDAVAGTDFGRAMLDWNLPPLRFERAGVPGLYASYARLSVFGGALVTNLDDAATRRRLANAGAQADVRFQLLTQQPLTLSIGYARAFERHLPASDEWMVSLKIL